MNLKIDPMKFRFKYLLLLCINFGLSLNSFCVTNNYVTIKGRQFYDKSGYPFYPLMCNLKLEIAFESNSVFYIAPHPQNGLSTSLFDCTDQATCFTQITDEFVKIKEMGFNCVRIAGSAPYYDKVLKKFYFHGWGNNLVATYNEEKVYVNDISDPTDHALEVYFNFLNQINLLAESLDLYFMIDVCPNFAIPDITDQTSIDNFNNLLRVTGQFINAHDFHNMYCYASVEEPLYTDPGIHSKSRVCDWVNNCYNTLKQYDPNHLITIGSHDVLDLMEWDLSLLDIDFLQVHVYPDLVDYDGPDHYRSSTDKVLGRLFWLKIYCTLPWMIGETGYSCKTGYSHPDVSGSETEQYDYASETLEFSRSCGASGYSWWFFQETDWNPYEDGLGLLYKGHSPTEAPIVSASATTS